MVTQILKTSLLMKQEETLILRESDKGNQIQFIFNDISSITSAEFRLIKPDNTFVISTGEIDTENNIITFDINEQCCTVPGKGRFNIRLIGTDINVYTYVGRCIIDINLDLENAVESTAESNGYTFPDDFLTSADLSNYATKTYVDTAVENVPVYTPINYSLTEQKTGLKWIDGKPIYQKTFNLTFTDNRLDIDLTALSVESVMKFEGGVYNLSGSFVPFGYESAVSVYTSSASNIHINNIYSSERTSGHVTIWYTKTTDTV